MGEKVGFTNCVFEKLCFTENTAKYSFSKAKNGMLKTTENLWKIVGCFWTWHNGVLGVCFFEVLVLLWFVFGVFGIVPGVLKMLVFPSFLGFCGVGLFLLILGLEGLGVFVFLVFVFVFCVAFVSVLFFVFVFVFVLLLDWFWCWFLLCVCFVFFFFCFFVLVFLFLFFCFLVSLEGLRVRWGGPKGHLTWP